MNLTLVKLIITGCFPLSLLLGTMINPVCAHQPQNPFVNLSQSSQNLESSNPLQQGKQYYQAGQFAEAVKAWQEALATYQKQGKYLKQVQALNYLTLAYQELGEWEKAENAIAKSLKLLPDSEDLDHKTLLLRGQALNNQG